MTNRKLEMHHEPNVVECEPGVPSLKCTKAYSIEQLDMKFVEFEFAVQLLKCLTHEFGAIRRRTFVNLRKQGLTQREKCL